MHVSSHYWFTERAKWSGMPHLCYRTNQLMSVCMVSSNQPRHKQTVLESFQQLKVSPACFWQVLVMFSECTTHYTDPARSVSACNVYNWNVYSCSFSAVFHECRVSMFAIAFATEVSTAAVFQLISNVFN